MSLRAPIAPSSPTRCFGTRKSEMPREPAGPPGTLASTMWTIVSESSCSPPEIHILVPKRR